MDKFFDRFKPKGGGTNPFSNLIRLPGQSFGGEGKSLGGSQPGKVIQVELKEDGPLGIKVEKRPNSQGTAIVALVVENSQADRAGIERGDILCFAGSGGKEEIMYDMFIELAKSNQRPLCFEVRRIKTNPSNPTLATAKAEDFTRKKAVIAAAETREKANKQKLKPIPKKTNDLPQILSTADRNRLEQERLARVEAESNLEPMSEAARKAIESVKVNEARTANSLGYNPYEAARATAGQARNATVALTHGAIKADERTVPMALPRAQFPSATEKDASISGAFQDAFELAVTSNDHSTVVSSFGILRKLLINVTTKGQDRIDEAAAAKFRRVRLGNAKIRAAVVDTEGAFDLMLSTGFRLVEEEGESVLVFPPGDMGPPWLSLALKQMESFEKS
jgi:hypothetical protein